MKETAVLLATYNGATFLTEQLNSLLGQSYPDFLIIAQDDGSRDETPKLLAHFAQRPAARCLVLTDDSAGVGACRNFGRLLDIALAHSERFKYFAFCDQDDWWAPDKLRLMTAQLRDFEQTYPEIPLLAHCDLEVVDSSLQVMAPSYWTNQRVNPAERRISSLLLRNTTVGCAMVINRRLAEVVLPFPLKRSCMIGGLPSSLPSRAEFRSFPSPWSSTGSTRVTPSGRRILGCNGF